MFLQSKEQKEVTAKPLLLLNLKSKFYNLTYGSINNCK